MPTGLPLHIIVLLIVTASSPSNGAVWNFGATSTFSQLEINTTFPVGLQAGDTLRISNGFQHLLIRDVLLGDISIETGDFTLVINATFDSLLLAWNTMKNGLLLVENCTVTSHIATGNTDAVNSSYIFRNLQFPNATLQPGSSFLISIGTAFYGNSSLLLENITGDVVATARAPSVNGIQVSQSGFEKGTFTMRNINITIVPYGTYNSLGFLADDRGLGTIINSPLLTTVMDNCYFSAPIAITIIYVFGNVTLSNINAFGNVLIGVTGSQFSTVRNVFVQGDITLIAQSSGKQFGSLMISHIVGTGAFSATVNMPMQVVVSDIVVARRLSISGYNALGADIQFSRISGFNELYVDLSYSSATTIDLDLTNVTNGVSVNFVTINPGGLFALRNGHVEGGCVGLSNLNMGYGSTLLLSRLNVRCASYYQALALSGIRLNHTRVVIEKSYIETQAADAQRPVALGIAMSDTAGHGLESTLDIVDSRFVASSPQGTALMCGYNSPMQSTLFSIIYSFFTGGSQSASIECLDKEAAACVSQTTFNGTATIGGVGDTYGASCHHCTVTRGDLNMGFSPSKSVTPVYRVAASTVSAGALQAPQVSATFFLIDVIAQSLLFPAMLTGSNITATGVVITGGDVKISGYYGFCTITELDIRGVMASFLLNAVNLTGVVTLHDSVVNYVRVDASVAFDGLFLINSTVVNASALTTVPLAFTATAAQNSFFIIDNTTIESGQRVSSNVLLSTSLAQSIIVFRTVAFRQALASGNSLDVTSVVLGDATSGVKLKDCTASVVGNLGATTTVVVNTRTNSGLCVSPAQSAVSTNADAVFNVSLLCTGVETLMDSAAARVATHVKQVDQNATTGQLLDGVTCYAFPALIPSRTSSLSAARTASHTPSLRVSMTTTKQWRRRRTLTLGLPPRTTGVLNSSATAAPPASSTATAAPRSSLPNATSPAAPSPKRHSSHRTYTASMTRLHDVTRATPQSPLSAVGLSSNALTVVKVGVYGSSVVAAAMSPTSGNNALTLSRIAAITTCSQDTDGWPDPYAYVYVSNNPRVTTRVEEAISSTTAPLVILLLVFARMTCFRRDLAEMIDRHGGKLLNLATVITVMLEFWGPNVTELGIYLMFVSGQPGPSVGVGFICLFMFLLMPVFVSIIVIFRFDPLVAEALEVSKKVDGATDWTRAIRSHKYGAFTAAIQACFQSFHDCARDRRSALHRAATTVDLVVAHLSAFVAAWRPSTVATCELSALAIASFEALHLVYLFMVRPLKSKLEYAFALSFAAGGMVLGVASVLYLAGMAVSIEMIGVLQLALDMFVYLQVGALASVEVIKALRRKHTAEHQRRTLSSVGRLPTMDQHELASTAIANALQVPLLSLPSPAGPSDQALQPTVHNPLTTV